MLFCCCLLEQLAARGSLALILAQVVVDCCGGGAAADVTSRAVTSVFTDAVLIGAAKTMLLRPMKAKRSDFNCILTDRAQIACVEG